MHRHIVVVTFLEWLNWNNKGILRIAPQRLVWCHVDGSSTAFQSSLQFAPDLEPADDAFLVANVKEPPRAWGNGTLLLPLDGTTFEVLSERSSRLLSPAAKRMNANLEVATENIQDMWVRWKELYNKECADQQSRRIWAWAWANPWPSDPECAEERLLMKTRNCLTKMSRLLAEKPETLEKVSGTSAEPWLHMALAAEQEKLLSPEKDADWRKTSHPYINSCVRSGKFNTTFFSKAEMAFSNAFESLPLDRIEMADFLAVAIGEHHALRLNAGQEPDVGALVSDLRILADIVAKIRPDSQKLTLSSALLALGGLLPGSAVGALMVKADTPAGWAGRLLQCNAKQIIAEEDTQAESSRDPTATSAPSTPENESGDNGIRPPGKGLEALVPNGDLETAPQSSGVVPEMSDVSSVGPATVAPSESKGEGDRNSESPRKNSPNPRKKSSKPKKAQSSSNEDDASSQDNNGL